MSFPEFVDRIKYLKIKKKERRPHVAANKFYPNRVELEAIELVRDELEQYGLRLEDAATANMARDSVDDVVNLPDGISDDFKYRASMLANKVSDFNVMAFADYSDLVVGERYFPSQDDKFGILDTWTENFVNLCRSANDELKKKVAGTVSDGVLKGTNIRDISKSVRNTVDSFSKAKANLIARTEVGKLNSAIAKNQSESAGIEYYEWSASMDGRTRQSHAIMDGKICKWGDDTHYYEWVTGADGKRKLERRDRPKTAYMGAPGTDFQCRCTALPYVPEYEDDYEETREKGPIQGVTQERPTEGTPALPSAFNGKVSSAEIDAVTNRFYDKFVEFGLIGSDKLEQQKKTLKEGINRLPEKLKRKWVDIASNIKIEKKERGASHYSPQTDSVAFTHAAPETVIHEISHALSSHMGKKEWIDNHVSTVLANNPLKAKEFKDSENMMDRCLQINIGDTAYKEFVQGFSKEVKNVPFFELKVERFKDFLTASGIEVDNDVVSCASDWLSLSGYDSMGWGHKKSYQKDYRDLCKYYMLPQEQASRAALSVELGAEIPEILSCNGGKEFLENFLPNTLKQYEENIIDA